MTRAYATGTLWHEHWTVTSRTDPRQRAKHDFRNTLQALVLAAAGGDAEYARGLLVDLKARYEAADKRSDLSAKNRTRRACEYLAQNKRDREAK